MLFKSVGVQLRDVAVACAVVEHALSWNDATVIEHYDSLSKSHPVRVFQ